jgi:RHS repeat-associated protein
MGGSYARTGLPQTFTGTYNSGNRLTSYIQNGGSAVTLSYDSNGNLTNDGTNTLTWDSRDELTKIAAGHTTVASYAYDGFGRRAKAVVGTATTQYLYDFENPVAEQGATGTLSAGLLTGPGVDEVYARTPSGGAQSSFLSDALGSTIGLADASGIVQTSYTYDPFGVTTSSGQANGSSYRYTGREADAAGLIYYRARYYKPSLGRFISEDPIGFDSGSNLYAYAMDSPTNLTDPYGTCVGPLIELLPWCVEAGITTGEAAWTGVTAAEAVYLGTWLGNKYSSDPYSATATQSAPIVFSTGFPRYHTVRHPSRKGAREAAQQEGKGQPMHHPSPRDGGDPHYHPTDGQGRKIPGVHHGYPR